jgi:hypothetical protein
MRFLRLALVVSLALAPPICAWAQQALPTLTSPRPKLAFDVLGLRDAAHFAVKPAQNFSRTAAETQAAAAKTIPLWSQTVTASNSVQYTYQMVGKNPLVVQAAPTTKINAVVIPVRLVFTSFSNHTTDPAAADAACSPAGTAVSLTGASPLFNTIPGNIWGTNVGTGEYADLFRRADFNTQTEPNGINPKYHLNLAYTPGPGITINVSGGDVVTGMCGQLALMDFATWDNYIQTQLMPLLAARSPRIGPPSTLVVFLLYNTVLFENSTSNCCILGYHSAFNDPSYGNAFHTYVSVEFDTNKSFTGVADISAMSHEIAEWMDDPSGVNPTPSWGNIGQVSGCQANLEVGDPLSGTLSQIYMPSNHYTYHVQDLAFTSWFYGAGTSNGVNGWYSFLGNFLGPAAPC